MPEGIVEVRNALVEAIAAKKLVEDKLEKAKEDCARWKQHLTMLPDDAERQSANNRIRQLELTIAEWETDRMAQEDLEKQLKATIFRLENSVPNYQQPAAPNLDEAQQTIDRFEKKILEEEECAELSSHSDQRKLDKAASDLSLDNELAQLKQRLKKSDDV